MVVDDVDFEEVDDVVIDDTVVKVAESSAEDQGEGDRGDGEMPTNAPEHSGEDDNGDGGEGDKDVADGGGRGVFGEHAEGSADVVNVGDPEDARDDGMGLAVGELLGDDAFRDAVEDDDKRGDAEHEAASVFRFSCDCG